MNRDYFAGSCERHPKMAGAVIGPFIGVHQKWQIFRNEVVEESVEIGSRFGVGVLHYHKAGAGMLDEEGHLSASNARIVQKGFGCSADLVSSFAVGPKFNFVSVSLKCHILVNIT